jgi:Flp pilus assembly protein TadD
MQYNACDAALLHFDAINHLNPTNQRAHYLASECLNELGQVEQAIARLKTAIELAPDSGRWVKLGNMYMESGDQELADWAYEQAEPAE